MFVSKIEFSKLKQVNDVGLFRKMNERKESNAHYKAFMHPPQIHSTPWIVAAGAKFWCKGTPEPLQVVPASAESLELSTRRRLILLGTGTHDVTPLHVNIPSISREIKENRQPA